MTVFTCISYDDAGGGSGCDVDDDIYIMMQRVFVCRENSSLPTSELSARGAK